MIRIGLPDVAGGLRLLLLGAHADDIEIGAGGTVLRLIAEGRVAAVRWVVFSAVGERAAEARRGAAGILAGLPASAVEVVIHEFEDGYFPASWEAIKRTFDALASGPEPDLVLAPRLADRHQDHRLLAELTWNTFRDHLVLEYEIPKYEGDLGQPNVYVPLSAEIVEAKLAVLAEAFPSQRDRDWFDAASFRSLLRIRGLECRAPSGHAEAFEGRKLVV